MSRHPYYRDQLNFLIDGGLAMAKAHPRDADLLAGRLDDPDVERLLEGIAFFVGQITEKQVRNLSQLCQFLFDILFPHYLCPVPGTAVVEFKPSQWADLVPRGTEVHAIPVRGTACRFVTAYDTDVGPLEVVSARWSRIPVGGALTVQFKGAARMDRSSAVKHDRLRLHLHGDPKNNNLLYYFLLNRLEQIELLDEQGEPMIEGRDLSVAPLGFGDLEALFPYPEGSFSGFRLLLEYFSQPSKFLFIDVKGLWTALAGRVPPGDGFGLRFNFRLDQARVMMVSKQHIRLGCTPVVNAFQHYADPIRRDPGRAEFPIRPAGLYRHYEIYRVLDVSGWAPPSVVHYPILSELDLDLQGACSQIYRMGDDDLHKEYYLYLKDPDEQLVPENQTILVDLICSNGQLPEGLQVGDIQNPQPPYDHLKCQNITKVTMAAPVPDGEDLRQRLVSHLALTQLDLASQDGLYESIHLYNPLALRDEQVRWAHNLILSGLLKVETAEVFHRHHGIPVRGKSILLDMGEGAFDSEGDLYLFGCVLNEFIALQAPLNWFTEFSIRWTRTKGTYKWPKRLGKELLTS